MRLILLISTLIILFPLTRGDQKQRTLSCTYGHGEHVDTLKTVIHYACQWVSLPSHGDSFEVMCTNSTLY